MKNKFPVLVGMILMSVGFAHADLKFSTTTVNNAKFAVLKNYSVDSEGTQYLPSPAQTFNLIDALKYFRTQLENEQSRQTQLEYMISVSTNNQADYQAIIDKITTAIAAK